MTTMIWIIRHDMRSNEERKMIYFNKIMIEGGVTPLWGVRGEG